MRQPLSTSITQLTVDQAIGEFHALLREELGDAPADVAAAPATPATPEEEEHLRFACAELILRAVCPDPRACTDQRCRRHALCRHFSRVQAKRHSGVARNPRRTPGAEAVRYAIWVFMASAR
jgi:hypothetical protein